MVKRMSKAEKEAERRADRLAQSSCNGFSINLMDLSKVSAKAAQCVAAGMDDESALASIREYVATFATRAA